MAWELALSTVSGRQVRSGDAIRCLGGILSLAERQNAFAEFIETEWILIAECSILKDIFVMIKDHVPECEEWVWNHQIIGGDEVFNTVSWIYELP